jgi:hypothetical protein
VVEEVAVFGDDDGLDERVGQVVEADDAPPLALRPGDRAD